MGNVGFAAEATLTVVGLGTQQVSLIDIGDLLRL